MHYFPGPATTLLDWIGLGQFGVGCNINVRLPSEPDLPAPCVGTNYFDATWALTNRVNELAQKSTVLIVEDELLIRMHAVEMIEAAGFGVVEAANADEAIAILEVRPDIHVVFTDVQMPGSMDGLKLARFVRHRWPPIKIVATSGHIAVRDEELPEGSLFLQKPYRADQVVATLRQVTGM